MDKIQQVVTDYRNACESLAEAVNEYLFDSKRRCYWVKSEIGGVCDFGDEDFLSPADMVLILDSGMKYEQYEEWRDANVDSGQFINLHSWLMGLRHSMLKTTNNDRI